MNNRKCGLIVEIRVHNILNEWKIVRRVNPCLAYQKALRATYDLVNYGRLKCTPCVATALELPFRHLQPNPKGLVHSLNATVLILKDTALKGLRVYG